MPSLMLHIPLPFFPPITPPLPTPMTSASTRRLGAFFPMMLTPSRRIRAGVLASARRRLRAMFTSTRGIRTRVFMPPARIMRGCSTVCVRTTRSGGIEHGVVIKLDYTTVTIDGFAFLVAFTIQTDFAAAFVAVPENK